MSGRLAAVKRLDKVVNCPMLTRSTCCPSHIPKARRATSCNTVLGFRVVELTGVGDGAQTRRYGRGGAGSSPVRVRSLHAVGVMSATAVDRAPRGPGGVDVGAHTDRVIGRSKPLASLCMLMLECRWSAVLRTGGGARP
jgi:hypothetical protein